MEELVMRMRTFTILKWCGMPRSLNPRKCAKMGFICTDECKMICSDSEGCNQEVCLPTDVTFCTDKTTIERAELQVAQAHLPTCKYRHKQWLPVMTDWGNYLTDPNAGLISRRCLYLGAQEILSSLLKSVEPYKDRIQFNWHESKAGIQRAIGSCDPLDEVLDQLCQQEDTGAQKCVVLALTGWRCIPQDSNGFVIECISCFAKVHSQLLEDPKFEFQPVTSHHKHCFFNAHQQTIIKKEDGTKIMVSMLTKRKLAGLSNLETKLSWNQQEATLKHKRIILDQLLSKHKIDTMKTKQIGQETLLGKKRTFSELTRKMTFKEIQAQIDDQAQEAQKRMKRMHDATKKIESAVKDSRLGHGDIIEKFQQIRSEFNLQQTQIDQPHLQNEQIEGEQSHAEEGEAEISELGENTIQDKEQIDDPGSQKQQQDSAKPQEAEAEALKEESVQKEVAQAETGQIVEQSVEQEAEQVRQTSMGAIEVPQAGDQQVIPDEQPPEEQKALEMKPDEQQSFEEPQTGKVEEQQQANTQQKSVSTNPMQVQQVSFRVQPLKPVVPKGEATMVKDIEEQKVQLEDQSYEEGEIDDYCDEEEGEYEESAEYELCSGQEDDQAQQNMD